MNWLIDHYHGTPYVGLIGGAVEVYARSIPWSDGSDSPRPIPFQDPLPYELPGSLITVVVPIIGTRLAQAVNESQSDWDTYIVNILSTAETNNQVGVFPIQLPGYVNNALTTPLDHIQSMDPASACDPRVLCRELSQQVSQLIRTTMDDSPRDRLTVFISHTKKHSPGEEPDYVDNLISQVLINIQNTHLNSYFDVMDLQPGTNWKDELSHHSASNSLLAIRTGLYARREWCQREFLEAKQSGAPIVTLNAIRLAVERGSFLMDHVPVVGYRDHDDASRNRNQSIEDALNLLVDETLRRDLWKLQTENLSSQLDVDWTPAEAPKPITVIPWLMDNSERIETRDPILVMHPDPPLGPVEMDIIKQLFALVDAHDVDIVTPHTYINSGGNGI